MAATMVDFQAIVSVIPFTGGPWIFTQPHNERNWAVETQELEIHYSLGKYGWSDIRFFDLSGELRIRATHIFNNPLAEILQSVSELLKGSMKAEFLWFEEPGTFKIELKINTDQNHAVHIKVFEHESTGSWNDSDKTISQKTYYVKLQQLSASLYGEMVKLNELMKIKSFSENRNSDYPHRSIKEFMKEYERKFSYQTTNRR